MYQLYNDDCFNIFPTLSDKSVDFILCDPPYSVTNCKWDKILPFDELWKQYKRIIKDNGCICIFTKQPFTSLVITSNIDMFKYELIWVKQQATAPMLAKKRILPIHENILIFYKKQCTYNPQMRYGFNNYKSFSSDNKNIGEIYGDIKSEHRNCDDGSRYPISVLYYNNVRKTAHPTQKPIALLEYLIKTYTNENDLVLDNCMGSGSTGVACINTNRNFIGIEIEKKYYDIAEKRIKDVSTV